MLLGKLNINKQSLEKITVGVLYLFSTILLAVIFYSPFLPENISLNPADLAPETIVSPKDIEFESKNDRVINQKNFDQIKNNISPVYSINMSISTAVIDNITLFFEEFIATPKENLGVHITQLLTVAEIDHLKSLTTETIHLLKFNCISQTNSLLSTGLKDVNYESLKYVYNKSLADFDEFTQKIALSIIFNFLQPNLTIDDIQTNLLVQQAVNSIEKKMTVYKKGHVILYQNEPVTKGHIEIFKALNMYDQKANILQCFGIGLLVAMSLLLLDRFVFYFSKPFYSIKYIALLLVVIILLAIIARIVFSVTIFGQFAHNAFLVPVALSSMLITFLVSVNLSLITGTIISVLLAIIFGPDYQTFVFLFLNNAVAAFTTLKSYKRSDVMLNGYYIGAANIVIIASLGLLAGQEHYMWYAVNSMFGFLNGVVCAMITLAILPYFEQLFKITTNQTLLELSNLNHPLLKRLMLDAPGTYQHSLMVANLSEAAAEEIGANTVLCRVGSYFHDVGKLKRPIFFSENQFSPDNPHDTISPRMSKMIIISHVKDGLEWAQKHKLPAIIKEIIQQHHGTSLLSVFYLQAISKDGVVKDINKDMTNGDTNSEQEEFRYPGPKPQTKEAGIIMLADSVEAATRSLKNPTPNKIENIIAKVFKGKIDDLQLSECPLSLREIYTIKETFLYLYKGMQHKRVDYLKEIQKLEPKETKET